MSSDRLGLDQTRFMPAPVEERLIGILARAGGTLLLAIVIAVWVSLLTWNVTDPSLTHATGGNVSNVIGPIGAIVSDLLLQTLGFTSVILTLAPMFWAIELLNGERVWNFRTKAAFVPPSVLLLAGALSSLPVSSNWPLHHGMGGMIGDIMLKLVSSLLGIFSSGQTTAASGILFFMAGLPALIKSAGFEMTDLHALLLALKPSEKSSGDGATWHQNLRAEAGRLRARLQPTVSTGQFGPADYGPATHAHAHYAAAQYAAAPDGYPARGPYPPQDQGMDYADDADDWMDNRQEPSFGNNSASHFAAHGGPGPDYPAIQSQDNLQWAVPQPPYGGPVADEGGLPEGVDVRTGFAIAASRDYAPGVQAHSSLSMARRFASTRQPAPDTAEPLHGLIKKPAFLRERRTRNTEPVYKRPPVSMLKRAAPSKAGGDLSQTALRGTARLLEDVLADFGIKGEMRDVRPGPVVTLFEFEPARGTKTSRIIALADDIARSMSVTSVRVAVVPGRSVIGIELPNVKREMVMLRDMFEADAYRNTEAVLPVVLGKSIGGDAIVADLARMPHLLVAGTTGSGKSVGVNAMILSLLYRHSPEHCRMLMIDPKMLELSVYNGIPHLLTPVVTDPAKAVSALNWAVSEMEERYKRMSKLSVRNIDAFNLRVREARSRGEPLQRTVQTGFDRHTGAAIYESQDIELQPMPYIVIIVDEFADLMTVAGKDIETAVQRLAQMARAASSIA